MFVLLKPITDRILIKAGEQLELFDGQFPVGYYIVVTDQQISREEVCFGFVAIGDQEGVVIHEEGVDAAVKDCVSDFVSQHNPADLFREVGVDVDDLDAVAQLVEAAHSTRQRYEQGNDPEGFSEFVRVACLVLLGEPVDCVSDVHALIPFLSISP